MVEELVDPVVLEVLPVDVVAAVQEVAAAAVVVVGDPQRLYKKNQP
jgi:hypothetical protein